MKAHSKLIGSILLAIVRTAVIVLVVSDAVSAVEALAQPSLNAVSVGVSETLTVLPTP